MHDHSMEPTGYTKEDMCGSGMNGGYGMHNSSCPVTQLLEMQCAQRLRHRQNYHR